MSPKLFCRSLQRIRNKERLSGYFQKNLRSLQKLLGALLKPLGYLQKYIWLAEKPLGNSQIYFSCPLNQFCLK
jgi:hypothetical protein